MFKGNAKHIFLTAAFAVIIFSVPLSQIGIDLAHGDRPQLVELFTQAPTKANLKNFEKDMEKASW